MAETVDEEFIRQNKYIVEINEWFACYMLVCIAFDLTVRYIQQSEPLHAWNCFRASLQYFLVYRIFSSQALELVIEACCIESPYPAKTESELSK